MMPTVETANSLFQQPWWLDATAPGAWAEATVERGGELVARWPYTLERRFGLRVLGQPPLSLFLGPWLAHPGEVKHSTRLARESVLWIPVRTIRSESPCRRNVVAIVRTRPRFRVAVTGSRNIVSPSGRRTPGRRGG